ncbi:HAD-like domain-containing protein [Lipomyces tetrasporus]|uniref:phosphoserine phosphatase n=1 Tax=Lipomyces tetrasporus TaxID=54092 RepID=A0AAD7VS09_9ASCO|nr:HAD-like domain-containing protein [Lipomyces tetrasporus]KAJ8100552.1 HAD-like domain-containing protein [Lipomyces tetrasporus]
MVNYVATLISKTPILEEQRQAWLSLLDRLQVSVTEKKNLSDRAQDFFFDLPDSLGLEFLRAAVNTVCKENAIDIALQPNDRYRRGKRLVVFDMDSTLIQQEVIDMIAAFADVEDQVSAITSLAMNGLIDFNESLRRRASLLEGIPSTVFESLKSQILLTPGAVELCKVLKKEGYQLAVLSGGFIPLANWIKSKLGLDYAFANQLEVSEDGTALTGKVLGDIVNAERKAQLLRYIAETGSIELGECMAVGDGANDLKMMHTAGYGIAFNAKPIVQEKAPARLNTRSLQDVLYILGYSLDEQNSLLDD